MKFEEFWKLSRAHDILSKDFAREIWQAGFVAGFEIGKEEGIEEGAAAQAIIELRGREKFLQDLKNNQICGTE